MRRKGATIVMALFAFIWAADASMLLYFKDYYILPFPVVGVVICAAIIIALAVQPEVEEGK